MTPVPRNLEPPNRTSLWRIDSRRNGPRPGIAVFRWPTMYKTRGFSDDLFVRSEIRTLRQHGAPNRERRSVDANSTGLKSIGVGSETSRHDRIPAKPGNCCSSTGTGFDRRNPEPRYPNPRSHDPSGARD